MKLIHSFIKHNAYAVLRISDYRNYIVARFFLTFAIQMQSVIVGWQIYEHTHDVLSLGMIGLAEAIPFIAVAFFSGYVADIINRKKIIEITVVVYLFSAIALLFLTMGFKHLLNIYGVFPIYSIIFLTGIARGFFFPAASAYMAQIVPRELYANSSTWNSTIWHIAAISGPACGGLIYGFLGIIVAYSMVALFVFISLVFFARIHYKPLPVRIKHEKFLESLSAGIKFVFNNQIILGALSLDMFAVLFGGATAMLPVFAAEILHVGPQGLGFLRAPAFGAIIMAFILAYYPPISNSGKKLLICVACFGVSIILFAISKNLILSIFALAASGLFDNVSVIVRGTIIQLATPDEMRGRVAAINSIFIGSSNEIGSFESGVAARMLKLVPSVIFGGIMTVSIVGIIARFSPQLRKMNLKTDFNN